MPRTRLLPPILLVVCSTALAATSPPVPEFANSAGSEWNLLLITIDTLRADALGTNGNRRASTPHLDALAAQGVNFVRARASVPLTLPAHASLMTGTYPPVHGVRDNGGYRLPEEARTLAEVLRQRGYRTAAFVGSFVLDHRFGLAQGFETYDDRTWNEVAELESLTAERPAGEVGAAFGDWFEENGDEEPFFAWVHLYDPHAPYDPPEPFASRFAADPYAGEVAYADDAVGRMVEALRQRSVDQGTLVAVVGDHGEGAGEHGESTHSLLIYESTLHVPMILWGPGRIGAGRSVAELVGTVDLAATLLDYLGIDAELGESASLRPLIERRAEKPPRDVVYSESLYASLHLGWSALRGLETGRYHLIEAPRPELYDVVADPAETVDLASRQPADLARLRRRLAELERGFPSAPTAAANDEPDAAAAARLRSLGYLSSTVRPGSGSAMTIDPKDRIGSWERMQLGMARFAAGDHAAATALFEGLLASDGPTPLVLEYLGACYAASARWDEALAAYQRALASGADSVSLRIDLARLYSRRGEPALARRELDEALRLDPDSVVALHLAGDLDRSAGKLDGAMALYRRALEVDPDYIYSWNGLGMAAAVAGDDASALEAFRRAAAIAPTAAEARFNLAVQLERMGRRDEAAAAYRRFLELSSGESEWARQRAAATEALERLEGSAGGGRGRP